MAAVLDRPEPEKAGPAAGAGSMGVHDSMNQRSRGEPTAGRSLELNDGDTERRPTKEVQRLVTKLHLQQAELARRNEELRQLETMLQDSQDALMASEERYRALYELALLDSASRRRVERDRLMTAAREMLADQDDRRRLAEQLHGSIEQALALAGMKLGALRESHALEELDGSIRELAREMADFSQRLFPTALSDLGIVAASHWLVEEMARRSGVAISAPEEEEIEGVDLLLRIVLFRSLREILETLSGWAGVEQIRVGLRDVDARLQLIVTSLGRGFDDDQDPADPALLHTRDRLEQFGGRLDLRARPDGGVRILASLPLRLGVERHWILGR